MDRHKNAKRKLAMALFEAEAVKFGQFQLKMHEEHPDAPLSPIYLNLRMPPKGNLTDEIVDEIGELLWDIVLNKVLLFQVVVGLPKAGDPLAKAFVKASSRILSRDRLLFLEKEEAETGRRILPKVNGSFFQRDVVIMIDDLITGADTKLEAIEALFKNGLLVRDCLVLVDREQGGKEQLAEHSIKLHSVFTMTELLNLYIKEGLIQKQTRREVQNYQKEVEKYLEKH